MTLILPWIAILLVFSAKAGGAAASADFELAAADTSCPAVRISAVAPGPPSRRVNFTALVSSGADRLTYEWSVSSGKIVSQRGAMIFVEAPPGRVTASVKISGLDAACNSVVTESIEMR